MHGLTEYTCRSLHILQSGRLERRCLLNNFLCISSLLLISFVTSWQPSFAANPKAPPPSGRQFSREEFMVLNLNRGKDSAGAHISDSLRDARNTVKVLDRSLRQLQQVDREYAKSKGKPDDKFLRAASERLEQALKSAEQLVQDLETSRDELKDNIHQALIME